MINQSTLFIAIFLVAVLFTLPKKYLLAPYLAAACFIPTDQRIVIAGLDFTILRILIVVGVFRLFLRGEQRVITWNKFDKIVFAWAICKFVIYVILWSNMQAVIYSCGVMFDIIGLYWLFRQRIHSWKDIQFIIKVLSVCILIMVPLITLEWLTGNNPFTILGRITEHSRLGRVRCRGAFPHSIMFGLFWATLTPLFLGMAMMDKNKLFYWGAVIASIFAVIASASSTPLVTLIVILPVIGAFKWRQYTSVAWKIFLLSLVALHIVMKAPVWHLIARMNIVAGSTGWHRYSLIDQAIKHFGEWALLGCRSTAHWGWLHTDITNQYILEGVRGGFVTLALFLIMIYMALKTLLRASLQKHKWQFLAWCIYVAIIGHCVAFFGVSYYGQIMMWWFLLLAIVGFITDGEKKRTVLVGSAYL